MAKYTVNTSVRVWVSGAVQVKARSEKEAVKKALKELMTDRRYRVIDFDGNPVDFEEDDVEVLCVDKE